MVIQLLFIHLLKIFFGTNCFNCCIIFIVEDKSLDATFIKPSIILSLLRITSVLQNFFANWSNMIAYKKFLKSVSTDIKIIFKKDKINNQNKEKNIRFKNDNQEIISISNLYYGYKKNDYILNNLNINFKSGLNVLIGNNGCGKSTLLDIISGLVAPEKGVVLIEGVPMWENFVLSRKNIERRKMFCLNIFLMFLKKLIYTTRVL